MTTGERRVPALRSPNSTRLLPPAWILAGNSDRVASNRGRGRRTESCVAATSAAAPAAITNSSGIPRTRPRPAKAMVPAATIQPRRVNTRGALLCA